MKEFLEQKRNNLKEWALKKLFDLKQFLSNFHSFAMMAVAAYVATAFPYDDILAWSVVFFLMIFAMVNVSKVLIRSKTIGSFQSVIAFSLGIVGIILLRVNLSVEWVIGVSIISLTTVASDFIVTGSIRKYDYLKWSFDNAVYYTLMAFGGFMIWQNFGYGLSN